MANRLLTILEEIGLSNFESRVYFAALGLGAATVQQISASSGVKRTTVYSILLSLQSKGLIKIDIKGFKKKYLAEDPSFLENILEQRKKLVKDALPEFLAMYNLQGNESFIKYYEGIEGVKGVYSTLLEDVRPQDDYLIISNQNLWYNLAPEFFEDFSLKRARLPIKIRAILMPSKTTSNFKVNEAKYNFKVRILPDTTKLSTNLVVIPKKVVIHQLIPPIFAIVIENKSIVKMNQEFFEIIWSTLEPGENKVR
ncbi:MAG: hypothetical protein KBC84_03020 [Proteobacteria bacterium]|nr:hypothetical protein [Pseudomonadota bacterium]